MANVVMILGASGTGKSTSIRTLDPAKTVIFGCAGVSKRLPFKDSMKMYSKEKKNLFHTYNWETIVKYIKSIAANMPQINSIVIDDATYVIRNEFFDRALETGYSRFTEIADHFRQVLLTAGSVRDDLTIFLLHHIDATKNGDDVLEYKAATVGKLLDEKFNPLEQMTVVLFASPKFDADGKPEYGFYTQRRRVKGVELPAKSPESMFEDEFIPNDLELVRTKMNEYYGG